MPQIQVRDVFNEPIALVNIRLGINGQDVDGCYDDKFTDLAGNTSWPNPLSSISGYDLYVNYRNVLDDFENKSVHVNDLSSDISITLNRSAPQRISVNGLYLNKFIKGESAFLDYYRFLRGEDITPLLKQSLEYSSNARRNFLMTYNTGIAGGIGPCNPDEFGNDFYDKFPSFLDLYASAGIYLYGSVFPDNGLFPSWAGNTSKQLTHWNKLGEIARSRSEVFALELTNEPSAHPFNQVDTSKFSPISGVVCCSGSYGITGSDPIPNHWDVDDFHSPRDYPHCVVDCCVANHPSRMIGRAVGLGEPLGFGPGRETNRRIAKEIAGSAKGTAAFLFYHSTHGGFSQLYDNIEDDCATDWFGELNT